MVFTTYLFVFYFLPLVLAVYYALPLLVRVSGGSPTTLSLLRNAFLLLASYVFYGWWNPSFVLLILLITLVNYGCGQYIGRVEATARQRRWGLTAAVIVSLGTLGFFKYFTFLQQNINQLLAWVGVDPVQILRVTLPIGISFYTFQALSYSIDVYRRAAPRARSLIDFAAYISLFPQLIAGPIVRYNTVSQQLVDRQHRWEKCAAGASLFMLGFAKKVLLANPLGASADAVFGAEALGAGDAWFGAVAYALQIYFDFSGYSDMAIGLGRMIGFEFLKNFDAPYRADSITDFWRRWHISLSTFLRDYLYFPLGGNRMGPWRTYVNLAIVMLLGGLWHGANWTFVAWGAYHGLWLISERMLGRRSLYQRWPRPLRVAATFVIVLFSWVLFRSDSLAQAAEYLSVMFAWGVEQPDAILLAGPLYRATSLWALVVGGVVILLPLQAHDWSTRVTWPTVILLLPLFVVSLLVMFVQSSNPFLYFQF